MRLAHDNSCQYGGGDMNAWRLHHRRAESEPRHATRGRSAYDLLPGSRRNASDHAICNNTGVDNMTGHWVVLLFRKTIEIGIR